MVVPFYGPSVPSVSFCIFLENNGVETNAVVQSTIRRTCKRLVLTRIRCFCLSQATRDASR